MFSQIFDAIEEWMRGLLTGMINSNLDRMFTDVNQKTGEIASQVGQTPQGWNSSIFSMIENLSNSVIMPIAGIIITFVLCYELISMLTERNNMHDIDTWMFFKYFVKMWIAVYMFIQGHHIMDSVVMRLLVPVCNVLRRERETEIKELAEHNMQFHNELTSYQRRQLGVDIVLRKHTSYKLSPLYKKLEADIERFLKHI